ncbi:MAG: WD40 repeat domain-containing protein, partial [Myxococcales bacterium]|nr:WD40 repeat domain-containing protein [Myxococcales bacterium]
AKTRALAEVTALRVAGRTRLRVGASGAATLGFDGSPERALLGEGPALAVDLEASGRWAAVVRATGVEIWDASPRLARSLTQAGHRLARLVFAPSGRWLAGTSDDGGVQLWSLADGTRTIVRAAGRPVDALFFTADEASLVFADRLPRLQAWDLASGTARELPLGHVSGRAIDARPLADGGVLYWHTAYFEAGIQAFAASGERRFTLTLDEGISLAQMSADGQRLAVLREAGRADLWRVEGERLRREALELGDPRHRWRAMAYAADGTRARLAAALEEAGEVAGFVVWEVVWDSEGRPTAHLLHEDDAAREVVADRASDAVIATGAGGRELWQLASGATTRLPGCVAELHGFSLAADRGAVVLVGNAGARSVSETACFVDLASGALHRLATSGDPWAWDGRGALASVFKGAEVDVWEDPTPAEPDEFLGWLARQTARELPLAALMGR